MFTQELRFLSLYMPHWDPAFIFFFWCIATMHSRHPVHGYKMNVRKQIQCYTLQDIWTRATFVDISDQHLGEEPALLRTWPCVGPWPHPFWYSCMAFEKLSHLLLRRYRWNSEDNLQRWDFFFFFTQSKTSHALRDVLAVMVYNNTWYRIQRNVLFLEAQEAVFQ